MDDPRCILVAVVVHLASPYVAGLRAILPEGGLTLRGRLPHIDLKREIQRLLGAGR